MLRPDVQVEVDPENPISIRIVGGKALDHRTLVCQVNGDQLDDYGRAFDAKVIALAINQALLSARCDRFWTANLRCR